MSELRKFLFQGLPVRGMLVRLTDGWQEVLRRRTASGTEDEYPEAVLHLLGEMTAAALLMQSNIKFNGALVLQVFGDGPVKLAVVEVQPDLSFRATAKVVGEVPPEATLSQMVNVRNQGRCVVTLDPRDRLPGQQPYQGIISLWDDTGRPIDHFADVLQHYMLQSEQLDTTLVLAANDQLAAGLLIQRLPVQGEGNLSAKATAADEDQIGRNEDYARIAILASSLKQSELLELDGPTVLRRLFWEENRVEFEPLVGDEAPRFACNCSTERVRRMIHSLGIDEARDIVREQGQIEVSCDFCGLAYRFDAIDTEQIFVDTAPGSNALQ
ncbi:MAG: Hsp33 family molecular chaperone HslO [Alphaproteobacteria bacterium]|nr:Hsp33 family molecular chaperone HslO [Alphaproteobacteria bacterium]